MWQVKTVRRLIAAGLNDCEIGRRTGIPRGTVREWRHGSRDAGSASPRKSDCPICGGGVTDYWAYTYLLGLYLGDGCISRHPRGVHRLRIVLDKRYEGIIHECAWAMRTVRPATAMRVAYVQKIGCVEVAAYWKHWPCVFLQFGAGAKHKRKIELAFWQESLLEKYPHKLLRGLVHSDGCRALNKVNGTIYPRYQFTNFSADIRDIFCRACDAFGVDWKQSRWNTIAVSRRPSVAKLDLVIGAKNGLLAATSTRLPDL